MNKNENEFSRWFSQAKFDLEAAKVSLKAKIPHEFYQKEDAEVCVDYAEQILSRIEQLTKK